MALAAGPTEEDEDTGWMTKECMFDFHQRLGVFLFSKASGQAVGLIMSPVQWILKMKQLGCYVGYESM